MSSANRGVPKNFNSRATISPVVTSMPTHAQRQAELTFIAGQLRAVAHPDRLRLLALLDGGEVCVGGLEDQTELPQPIISRHLAILRRARIIDVRRVSRAAFYRLADPRILKAIKPLL